MLVAIFRLFDVLDNSKPNFGTFPELILPANIFNETIVIISDPIADIQDTVKNGIIFVLNFNCMCEYVLDQGSELAVLNDGKVDLGMEGSLHFREEVSDPFLLVEDHASGLLEVL